ncbi:hypothetical protein AN480_29760 [Mycobacterium intracellulare subsp. chimaera]|nr:hypothetical protein AN480_29760 [Mycobacterium intracellulare subsp. chimaera]ARV84802.1 hypothetical protein BWK49_28345 [Mycobacterium intracellulare subsp. chimaera]ASL12186.1 hypothetical protein MYCODSM44623_05512 [Mycobacterium intracellulare subsp. chimaera]ASL24135.1 hypothetical protein MYCOZU1_05774 [Mycobacterium intracellulare subsp. chimaera]MCA2308198.1 hypothetical protein [Mycobacterium intracellulare subsp. chimaera]
MAGEFPPGSGGGPATGPSQNPTQWGPPAFPVQQSRPPRAWLATALAAVAVLLGAAALVVALTRPVTSASSVSSTTSTTLSHPADQTGAARKKLCDAYKLAAKAVQIETNGTSPERANIATVNGAVILEEAVNSTPAIALSDRAAALTLAEAYSNAVAISSTAGGDDPKWLAAINDVISKDAPMRQLCGGG